MLNFIRSHPYVDSFIIIFLFLLFLGVFALDFSWGESLFGAAALSAIGVGSVWWKMEGFG
jgi:hypothetical protein